MVKVQQSEIISHIQLRNTALKHIFSCPFAHCLLPLTTVAFSAFPLSIIPDNQRLCSKLEEAKILDSQSDLAL